MRSRQLVRWSVAAGILSFAVAAHAQQAKTATQFYLEYRAAFDKATKIEDILPYMAAANRKQAEATPKADRDKMFEMIKMLGTLTEVKILKEEHGADGAAVLSVEGLDSDEKKTTGKVTIVKEDGAWKLGKEAWKS